MLGETLGQDVMGGGAGAREASLCRMTRFFRICYSPHSMAMQRRGEERTAEKRSVSGREGTTWSQARLEAGI